MSDAAIPLGIRQPQFQSGSDLLQQGLGMANLATSTQLNQARLQEERMKAQQASQALQDQQFIQKEFLDPKYQVDDPQRPGQKVFDNDAFRNAIQGRVNLPTLRQWDEDHAKAIAAHHQSVLTNNAIDQSKVDLSVKRNNLKGSIGAKLSELSDQDKAAAYPGFLKQLQDAGEDISQYPPTIPPDGSSNAMIQSWRAGTAYEGMALNDALRKQKAQQSASAAARADQQSANLAQTEAAKADQLAREGAAKIYSSVTTPEGHTVAIAKISKKYPEIAEDYTSLQYDPKTTQQIVQGMALTAEQRAQQLDKASGRDASAAPKTEAELARDSVDPKKSQQDRDAANAALKRLDQSKLASRPINNNSFVIPGLPTNGKTDPNANLTGEEYLATLPKGTASQIRAMMEGRATAPSAQTRTKSGQQLRAALFQADPEWSEQRAQIRKAFATGPDAKNIGALNTATVHLDQLGEAAKALDNGSFRPGNEVFNAVKTMFGGSAPTNFIALKSAVAGEMANALKGSATDIEIKNVGEAISSASSPKQLADVINTNLHTLGAKLNTYQERYNQQLPNDKAYSPILPSAKVIYDKHGISPITIQGKEGNSPAASGKRAMGGYQIGHVYSGMEYLGDDPNVAGNWRKH